MVSRGVTLIDSLLKLNIPSPIPQGNLRSVSHLTRMEEVSRCCDVVLKIILLRKKLILSSSRAGRVVSRVVMSH